MVFSYDRQNRVMKIYNGKYVAHGIRNEIEVEVFFNRLNSSRDSPLYN